MKHHFLDVSFTYKSLKNEIDSTFEKVISSGIYIGGDYLRDFENQFAEFCGAKHCVGVANGLDALTLSLRAYGIGPGDEVIVPAHTFIATWLAVTHVGATIVPVDADEKTMNIDTTQVLSAITEKTKAIIVVHLYGAPVDMTQIKSIASKYKLIVIEDAAQAHGAKFHNLPVGSLGDISAFSFYPGKNLGAFGDGGAVVTNDKALAEHIRCLGNYGSKTKYDHELIGFNSRLDPLQAAFLLVKLQSLEKWNKRRQVIADIYFHSLSNITNLIMPYLIEGSDSSWHLFVIRHKNRDLLKKMLADAGVPTALHYPVPNHQSPAFRKQFLGKNFPVAEAICSTCLSLPMGPHLSEDSAQRISNLIIEIMEKIR